MMMTTVSSAQNASTMIQAPGAAGSARPSEIPPARDHQDQRHEAEPEQEARDGAGEEQIGDRDRAAGRERIDHGVVGRRDQERLQQPAQVTLVANSRG